MVSMAAAPVMSKRRRRRSEGDLSGIAVLREREYCTIVVVQECFRCVIEYVNE